MNTLLAHLFKKLQAHSNKSFLVAYSGGLDSHVLLHAMSCLKSTGNILSVRAIHVDHGLQSASCQWSSHCKKTSKRIDIQCEIITLSLNVSQGESLEAVARDARYQAFKTSLKSNEILLTAHHQNDQAETVLLQLFRGSGVDGLAAMPESKAFFDSLLLRPLLDFSRQDLEKYADKYQLDIIDDPSNNDTNFDRNFLRHNVLPLLQTHWKGVNKSLSRVARLQAEAKTLLDESSLAELLSIQQDIAEDCLPISALLERSEIKQKALIRQWVKQLGFKAPSEIKLKHIIQDILHAKTDANPCVHWGNVELRRYQNILYAMETLKKHDASQIIPWNTQQALQLETIDLELKPEILGKLQAKIKSSDTVTVRFRQGGEKIRLVGHSQTSTLKKLMQSANIPPWQRDCIPLIYCNDTLIIVYLYWRAEL